MTCEHTLLENRLDNVCRRTIARELKKTAAWKQWSFHLGRERDSMWGLWVIRMCIQSDNDFYVKMRGIS